MAAVSRRRWWLWLLEAMVALAVVTGVGLYKTRDVVHGQVPPLQGRLIDGGRFDLKAWRGHPVLIQFWATWCPVCRLERGTIDALARDHRVITVALQSGNAAKLRRYMQESGLRFPVLPDPDGLVAERFGVVGVPTALVVDGRGRIRFVTAGYTSSLGLRARLWVARWW